MIPAITAMTAILLQTTKSRIQGPFQWHGLETRVVSVCLFRFNGVEKDKGGKVNLTIAGLLFRNSNPVAIVQKSYFYLSIYLSIYLSTYVYIYIYYGDLN